MWNALKQIVSKKSGDQKLIIAIKTISGISPSNLALYRLALEHSSIAKEHSNGFKESNERLEYLGDAILGAAVADYLFKKYPFKDEGFLTEIRSRIVNRESLNNLAYKIGIGSIVKFDQKNTQLQRVILGNTLEAIVGAVYMDKGYKICKKFVIDKLIQPHYDLEDVIYSQINYKSRIIEYTQRANKEIRFEITMVKKGHNRKEFSAKLFIDEELVGTGFGLNKKKAEQDASQKSCESLNIQ